MLYGYILSTTTEEDKQKKEKLIYEGVLEENILIEEKNYKLYYLLESLKNDDVFMAVKISDVASSMKDFFEIVDFAEAMKLKMILGKYILDFTSEIDEHTKDFLKAKLLYQEINQSIYSDVIKRGVKRAVEKGKKIGRPEFSEKDIPKEVKKLYKTYLKNKITKTEYAKMCNISRPTLDKYLKYLSK